MFGENFTVAMSETKFGKTADEAAEWERIKTQLSAKRYESEEFPPVHKKWYYNRDIQSIKMGVWGTPKIFYDILDGTEFEIKYVPIEGEIEFQLGQLTYQMSVAKHPPIRVEFKCEGPKGGHIAKTEIWQYIHKRDFEWSHSVWEKLEETPWEEEVIPPPPPPKKEEPVVEKTTTVVKTEVKVKKQEKKVLGDGPPKNNPFAALAALKT